MFLTWINALLDNLLSKGKSPISYESLIHLVQRIICRINCHKDLLYLFYFQIKPFSDGYVSLTKWCASHEMKACCFFKKVINLSQTTTIDLFSPCVDQQICNQFVSQCAQLIISNTVPAIIATIDLKNSREVPRHEFYRGWMYCAGTLYHVETILLHSCWKLDGYTLLLLTALSTSPQTTQWGWNPGTAQATEAIKLTVMFLDPFDDDTYLVTWCIIMLETSTLVWINCRREFGHQCSVALW